MNDRQHPERGVISDKRRAVPGPLRTQYKQVCCIFLAVTSRVLTASWQMKEDARYHEKWAIHASTERKKQAAHVQQLSQQLRETQEAMEGIWHDEAIWQERQLAAMREQYT